MRAAYSHERFSYLESVEELNPLKENRVFLKAIDIDISEDPTRKDKVIFVLQNSDGIQYEHIFYIKNGTNEVYDKKALKAFQVVFNELTGLEGKEAQIAMTNNDEKSFFIKYKSKKDDPKYLDIDYISVESANKDNININTDFDN